jgi:hypothetical protein
MDLLSSALGLDFPLAIPVGPENPSQPYTGRLAPVSSRRSPLIVMMQATHFWDFPDQSNLRKLYRPWHRTIHVQRPVRAPVMIILEVPGQEPPQMSLVQDDHLVQAFAAETPDEPFDGGILPRTPGGDHDVFDPHVPHSLSKRGAVDAIAVSQERPWRLVPGEGFDDLLCGPLRGGVLSDVDMDETPSRMGQDEQDKQYCVGHRRHDKDIQGHQILHVVLQEGLPRR